MVFTCPNCKRVYKTAAEMANCILADERKAEMTQRAEQERSKKKLELEKLSRSIEVSVSKYNELAAEVGEPKIGTIKHPKPFADAMKEDAKEPKMSAYEELAKEDPEAALLAMLFNIPEDEIAFVNSLPANLSKEEFYSRMDEYRAEQGKVTLAEMKAKNKAAEDHDALIKSNILDELINSLSKS